MPIPSGLKAIDLMMNIPDGDPTAWYEFIKPLLLDEESRKQFKMPAEYMFKDIPQIVDQKDYVGYAIAEMDKWGIEQAMLGISGPNSTNLDACRKYPDRFFTSYGANPNNGMEEVRKIRKLHKEHGLKAVTGFPSGLCPQVPLNDKKYYPIYATCVDLDIPICVCVGVPGPRIPMEPQKVEHIDEVCWFFPELKFVMRHGGEPWVDLAVKLMLKYPNLYYSTSAFAPKHYPKSIIHYANTRGADKIMFAGYFPMGLSLERIFTEMQNVPFKDHVWPKFLRQNAQRVFKLEQ
ncbi:MAG: amidohydrolase [Deltaproteobacteria bacterium]|nr:amidohydrolase [Deltaproteobacteria bacterium]MBW2402789.1 amidohydrolase [Deltaproteobacteria bacterium]MBW2546831.1 amidohydrolase [Deltaproteobacteria bacterium]RLB52234.1 MAG: amidohydrolase [Deltaproteobacteria bacterium]